MTLSNDDSCKYGMTDPQPATRAETKQSGELTASTIGPARALGYKTTSKDAPLVNRTKISPIDQKHPCLGSHRTQKPNPFRTSLWTSLLDYLKVKDTMQS